MLNKTMEWNVQGQSEAAVNGTCIYSTFDQNVDIKANNFRIYTIKFHLATDKVAKYVPYYLSKILLNLMVYSLFSQLWFPISLTFCTEITILMEQRGGQVTKPIIVVKINSS